MDRRGWLSSLLSLSLLLSACGAPVVETRTIAPSEPAGPTASPASSRPAETVPPTIGPAEPSPSGDPAAPSPSTGPDPTAGTTAGPGATPSPGAGPATPGPDGWIGPQRVGTRPYEQLSLVVDTGGVAHAAAELNDGIFYLTNATGSWTRERISTAVSGGSDREPSIAYDPEENYLAVAFTRYSRYRCEELGCFPSDSAGVHVVANYAGSWSDPFAVTAANAAYPVLRTGNGQLHLAYERSTRRASFVHHATDSAPGPEWVDTQVGEGSGPKLAVGSDGQPRLAFINEGIFYAPGGSVQGQPFVVQPVLGAQGWPDLLLDSSDTPHIVYTSWEDPWSIRHTSLGSGGWSESELVLADETSTGAAIDEGGGLHVIYDVHDAADEDDLGLYYVSNRSGSWVSRQVDGSTRAAIDGPSAGSAIAVDSAGRPHILYMVPFDDDRFGLYYAVGPGD